MSEAARLCSEATQLDDDVEGRQEHEEVCLCSEAPQVDEDDDEDDVQLRLAIQMSIDEGKHDAEPLSKEEEFFANEQDFLASFSFEGNISELILQFLSPCFCGKSRVTSWFF